jgi:hypothetical protein
MSSSAVTVSDNSAGLPAELRLPPYFPKTKGCADVAKPFFKCFEENAVKLSADDKEAGLRGLKMCLKEKAQYKKCMAPLFDADKIKKHRVRSFYSNLFVLTDAKSTLQFRSRRSTASESTSSQCFWLFLCKFVFKNCYSLESFCRILRNHLSRSLSHSPESTVRNQTQLSSELQKVDLSGWNHVLPMPLPLAIQCLHEGSHILSH